MRRILLSLGAAAALIVAIALASAPLAGQSATAPQARGASGASKATFRTPWGDPDLEGIWTGSTITPLERPAKFAGRKYLSESEAADLEKQAVADQVDRPPRAGDPGTYNQVWFDPSSKVLPDRRTSLIVDPADGRIPYTPEGAKAQELARVSYGHGDYSSWLGMDTGERCITD